MDTYELIKSRRSPRSYSDKAISAEDLEKMFDAARWAASAYNLQPWRFIYADKEKHPELYNKILSVMVEFNQRWAKAAPVLIVTLVNTKNSRTGDTLSHARYDLGLAVGNMMIMATSLGISLRNMSGFDANKAREVLNIPENMEAVTIIAAGYRGLPENLPPDMYKMETMPRERLELSEIVFNKVFDKE